MVMNSVAAAIITRQCISDRLNK